MTHPTSQTYDEIERAFDFFNEQLFDSRLPRCLITLQRTHDTYGYFSRERFISTGDPSEKVHEIALNPCYFAIHPIEMTLSVLVREMVSLDQCLNGEPGRRRYKNKQWADMLEKIGLMPSDTGEPGGRRVGEHVNHYIIDGGPFDHACAKLVDDQFRLSFVDRFPPMPAEAIPPDEDADQGAGALVQDPASAMTGNAPILAGSDDDDGLTLSSLMANSDAISEPGDAAFAPLVASNQADAESAGGKPEQFAEDKPSQPSSGAPNEPQKKQLSAVQLANLASQGIELQAAKKAQSREKYTCPSCKVNIWGKPGLRFRCLNCVMEPEMVAAGVSTNPNASSDGAKTPSGSEE